MSDAGADYAEIVRALGVSVETRGRWAGVGVSERTHGWKLHLSTIPVQASQLLGIVVPILCARQVPFKFARNEEILALLNEGGLGSTQIGKFITVYPGSDVQSRSLADELTRVTQDFDGPDVLTDLRLGRVVYTRYGGFHPENDRDRLGHVFAVLEDDGVRRRDERTVPFAPPINVVNPFADSMWTPEIVRPELDRQRLFGPGYLLLDVIKPDTTGSVFLALDMRDPAHVTPRVLKEGRAHCLSDRFGRDSRTRLRHQLEVHRALAGRVDVPAVDAYFDVGDNGYLALEFVDGIDIGAVQPRPFCALSPEEQQRLLARLADLAWALDALHTAGYVHRDLAPTNVRVRPDGSIVLLDLELAHALASDAPPFAQGTAGFMSPEQVAGLPPDTAQDMHGFGALMVLLLTGIDPRRVLYPREQGRQLQLERLGGLPVGLTHLVTRCIATEPARRPSAREAAERLRAEQAMVSGVPSPSTVSRIPGAGIEATRARAEACLPKIVRGLLQNALLDDETGLWLSPQSGVHHPTELNANYTLHRSTSRGVAGVIYALSRLAKLGVGGADVQDRVAHAVDWLLTHAATPDDQLPGLHFGEAGVALAIAESAHAGLLEPGRWLDEYLADALAGPLDWPDITHGAAGQGVAAMACGDLLHDERLAALSDRCAQYSAGNSGYRRGLDVTGRCRRHEWRPLSGFCTRRGRRGVFPRGVGGALPRPARPAGSAARC